MVLSYLLLSVLVFVIVQLLIELSNLSAIPKLYSGKDLSVFPRVSILIPARNEENNIKKCVVSLLRQDYPNFEVLVVNDNSEDNTLALLRELEKEYDNLEVLNGAVLEKGWYGKHWACHQLSQKASGEWILFTDADTHHSPGMLKAVMQSVEKKQTDLLTAIVREETFTIGEKLTVPFIVWSIFSLLPVTIGVMFKLPAFSAVIGQFMLFRRESYEKAGGHQAVRHHAADDVALGRLIIKNRMQWRIYNATSYVSCRMYQSFFEAFQGFVKNYFAIFDYKILISALVWLWLGIVAWLPLGVLSLHHKASLSNGEWLSPVSMAIVVILTLLWLIPVIKFKIPWMTILFYPFLISIAVIIGFASIFRAVFGKASWKGRELSPPPIRWF